jgi:hypothetical protein
VVQIEAHPKVAQRTGIDPIECLRFIQAIRNCRFVVCESPSYPLSLDKPFFEQFTDGKIYNVIACAPQ